MGRKRTFAEELAELATPAPVRGPDLDADDLGEGAKLHDSDVDEADQQPKSKRAKKAAEKPLRLRAGIDLQNKEYAGRRATRAGVFPAAESSESEDELDSTPSERAADLSQSFSEEHSESELEHSQRTSPSSSREQSQASASEHSGNSISEDELDDRGPATENGIGNIPEPAILQPHGPRLAQDRARSAAVRNQKTIWERVLELRIMLQQIVTASHRLPPPDTPALHPQSTNAVLQEGQAVLSALLDLQQSIVLANPLIQQQQQKAQSISDKPSSVDELWAAVDSSYSSIGQFRDSSLDRWYRKTLIGSGQALLKGNQRLLQQSISAQVAHMMSNVSRQARLSQLIWQDAPAQLCIEKPMVEEEGRGNDAGDPERYGDGDFYSQLLREFLEGHNSSGNGLPMPAVKASKKVASSRDRRASKGRRLRYDVQEKLVNFMVPLKYEEPPMASQLFSNIFGQHRM